MYLNSCTLVIFVFLYVGGLCEENITFVDSNENKTLTAESTNQESNVTSEKDTNAKELDNYSRKLLDEMGIIEDKEIDRERFTLFLKRLITRDEKLEPHELPLVDRLIQRALANAPETIKVNELSKYIQYDQLFPPIEEIMKEMYGEETMRFYENKVNSDL